MNGAGGYSAGNSEYCDEGTQVTNGGDITEPERYSNYRSGGSYFLAHVYDDYYGTSGSVADYIGYGGVIGGQGGNSHISNGGYWKDSGGDGGIAGKGGTIKASETATIYAYNGNKYTDGTNYESGLNQCPIYAQSGTLRAVYKLNCWWGTKTNHNYQFFYSLFGSKINTSASTTADPTTKEEKVNVLVRAATTCSTTGYTNPATGSTQGIGSGAGYIELSNGTYTISSALN